TTIFFAFMLMSTFGITINQISLAALIIALGLLVDNAIVVAETIMVRREHGQSATDAAIAAGGEMAIPLITSSLTTAAAFLPIYLAESAVGEYTADIFKVVTIALLSSWVLAMTFIPLLTIIFMKIKQGEKPPTYDSGMYRFYSGLLRLVLRVRPLFLLLVVGIFYSAIWALQFVPNVFIPPRTDPIITGNLTMPRGTAIEATQTIANDLEQFIVGNYLRGAGDVAAGEEGIVSWAAWIGEGAPRYTLALDPGSAQPGAINMVMNTTTHVVIPDLIAGIQDYLRENYPDLEVQLRKLENGTPIPYPIEVRVSGPDIATLYDIINPIRSRLWSTPGVLSVRDDWGPRSKKLLIDVDQERARRAGVTSEDVAVSLQAGLSGIELTQFREGDELIPVTMRSVAGDRQDIAKLEGMSVYSQSTGQTVPLSQVADIEIAWQPGIIKRRDRDRSIAVQAQLLPGVTATQLNSEFLPWLAEQSKGWPRRYQYEIGGESETSGDANEAIAAKLPIAGMIILLLLVAQFNNVRKPLIILMTIPLGLIGVVYGLLIAKSIFGFFTILGLISLSGIVINNAIVLIDRINIEINENGLSPADAIFSACKQRLRPILLTTATTIGGMLPLWISRDPMFETMSVSIIFGLLFATLLTLLVVPVLYSILFRVKFSGAARA
ncbi:MAG: efflux RND transporter permease subunit, partial [Gammaproteobacteria bacterium]